MTGAGDPVEGWRAPVHPSLVEPILFYGLPRRLGLFLGALAGFLVLEISVWMGPVFLLTWVLLALWHTYDPDGIDVVRRFLQFRRHYSG